MTRKALQISIWLIFCIAIIVAIFISQASADLGTFKQNDCIDIVVPLNSSSVNITNINSPSPNSTILVSNKVMTHSGNLFNYTFCNTTIMGRYTYGFCSSEGNCYGNSFIINGSGQEVTDHQITLIMIGLGIMLIFVAFFFILGFTFKHPGTKIFFMAISALTLIVLIGLIASNGSIYLAEFPGIVSIYNTYYIVVVSLSGAAMAGVILWLVWYSVNLFNKMRGRLPDE